MLFDEELAPSCSEIWMNQYETDGDNKDYQDEDDGQGVHRSFIFRWFTSPAIGIAFWVIAVDLVVPTSRTVTILTLVVAPSGV